MAKQVKAKRKAKVNKTRQLEVGANTFAITTYFLYRNVESGNFNMKERKYVGSFCKKFSNNTMELSIPDEGWTWKREAAICVKSVAEAKGLITLLDRFGAYGLKIEAQVIVYEW